MQKCLTKLSDILVIKELLNYLPYLMVRLIFSWKITHLGSIKNQPSPACGYLFSSRKGRDILLTSSLSFQQDIFVAVLYKTYGILVLT